MLTLEYNKHYLSVNDINVYKFHLNQIQPLVNELSEEALRSLDDYEYMFLRYAVVWKDKLDKKFDIEKLLILKKHLREMGRVATLRIL